MSKEKSGLSSIYVCRNLLNSLNRYRTPPPSLNRSTKKTMTPNKNESKPSIWKFKSQSVADLSQLEWLFLVLSALAVGYAASLMSIVMFAEETPDSPKFIFAIVLGVTSVFLLVYPVHGVFWRMPYSLVLYCLCHVVLLAYCIMYCILPEDKESILKGEQMPNGDQKSKIVIVVLAATVVVANVLPAMCCFSEYWQARTMIFPWGAETHNQDENVKHLFVMCLLLLTLHLELTFVAFVMKIEETGLAESEIGWLAVGVIYSTSMCAFGFLFLIKKWKPLVIVIPLASSIEVAYITYNLINTGQLWQGFPDEAIPAFIMAVSIACLAVRSFACWSLIFIFKHVRPEVDEK